MARIGAWEAQIPAPRPSGSQLPLQGLPGEADLAFDFVAPMGTVVPVGTPTRLQLTPGCGVVYWGSLEPEKATITADGTLTASEPGAIAAFAEQDGRRRYLQVASVADPAPATRFGPPAGWTLESFNDEAKVLASQTEFDALWRKWAFTVAQFATPGFGKVAPAESPLPGEPPTIEFGRHRVVAIALTLQADEADPVVTHIDSAGIHVVIPDATGSDPRAGRRVAALFRTSEAAATGPVLLHRHHGDRTPPSLRPSAVGASAVPPQSIPACLPRGCGAARSEVFRSMWANSTWGPPAKAW